MKVALLGILAGAVEWMTLQEMQATLQRQGIFSGEASISARLRELRGYPWRARIDSRVREGSGHNHEYRMPVMP